MVDLPTGWRIEQRGTAPDDRCDRYVQDHPRGTIYHQSAWLGVTESAFGHRCYRLVATDGHDAIHGVLPLVRLRSLLFGDYMVSLPFVNYGGAVGDSPDIERQLMDEACRLGDRLGVSHIEFRDGIPREGDWPVRTDKVEMILDLPDDPAALLRAIGAKRRSQIRRPTKEGAEFLWGGAELLDEFYHVFARNMRDLGTPVYGRDWFAAVLRSFPDRANIGVVRMGGGPVAAGLLLGDGGRFEIPWASSLREANRFSVNMLLYWKVIETAIEQGYQTFDFGRSTADSGTHRFKKQWGSREQRLYWHYWLARGKDMPRLTPDSPKYRLAVRAWQRLPLPLANLIGPHIVKNLP